MILLLLFYFAISGHTFPGHLALEPSSDLGCDVSKFVPIWPTFILALAWPLEMRHTFHFPSLSWSCICLTSASSGVIFILKFDPGCYCCCRCCGCCCYCCCWWLVYVCVPRYCDLYSRSINANGPIALNSDENVEEIEPSGKLLALSLLGHHKCK